MRDEWKVTTFQQEHITFGMWIIVRMVNIWMFEGIRGKDWENIKQFLPYVNHNPSMFIRHLWNIIFPELKLIDFPLFHRSAAKRFRFIISPAIVRFGKAIKFVGAE